MPEFSSATGSCKVEVAQCIYGTTAMAMQELLGLDGMSTCVLVCGICMEEEKERD